MDDIEAWINEEGYLILNECWEKGKHARCLALPIDSARRLAAMVMAHAYLGVETDILNEPEDLSGEFGTVNECHEEAE